MFIATATKKAGSQNDEWVSLAKVQRNPTAAKDFDSQRAAAVSARREAFLAATVGRAYIAIWAFVANAAEPPTQTQTLSEKLRTELEAGVKTIMLMCSWIRGVGWSCEALYLSQRPNPYTGTSNNANTSGQHF